MEKIYVENKHIFDQYLPAEYAVKMTAEGISIHYRSMELVLITKYKDYCRVCCYAKDTSFFETMKVKLERALRHVKECLQDREIIKKEERCPYCITGWQETRTNVLLGSEAMTDGHISLPWHKETVQRRIKANIFDLDDLHTYEKKTVLSRRANQYLKQEKVDDKYATMFTKAAITIITSFPELDVEEHDEYVQAIHHVLNGIDFKNIITIINAVGLYQQKGEQIYNSFFAPAQEGDMSHCGEM